MVSDPIIGGDGYFYVPYTNFYTNVGEDHLDKYDLRMMRVSSTGASNDIPIANWTNNPTDLPYVDVHVITNADTGTVLTWQSVAATSQMAITNGTGVSLVNGPQFDYQLGGIKPALQLEDGSFIGTVEVWWPSFSHSMIAFDASGNMRWSVQGNYQPLIATADGGIVAQGLDPDTDTPVGPAVIFDQSGNVTGQMGDIPVYSWVGNAYRVGSIDQIMANSLLLMPSWWPLWKSNSSGNETAEQAQRYPPLPSCTDPTKPLVCPAVGDMVWNAKQDLIRQLTGDAACKDAAITWVLNKVRYWAIIGSGSLVDFGDYVSYLQKTPRFYNGSTSKLYWHDAFCGEHIIRPSCNTSINSGKVYQRLQQYPETTAATVTPSNPLKVFWQPRYTPPGPSDDGIGIGIDPSNFGVNISNESVLFHEALHGLTGQYDDYLQEKLGRTVGGPTANITTYIKDNVLSKCPSFR